jgi:hypothetical protein
VSWSVLAIGVVGLLGLYSLYALWRVIASGNGCAQTGFAAAYLLVALAARNFLPEEILTPIWIPLIYPYAWCALTGVFWSVAHMQVSRRGVRFDGQAPRLSAFLLAQMALHLGILASAHLTRGRSLILYGTLPPVMVCLGMALYAIFLFIARRRSDGTVGWSPLIVFSILTPLIGILFSERVIPWLLRHL